MDNESKQRSIFVTGKSEPSGRAFDCPGSAVDLVPDTLDLADHGRMAINGVIGSLDPQFDCECTFLNILDMHPAYMLHWGSMVSGVMP